MLAFYFSHLVVGLYLAACVSCESVCGNWWEGCVVSVVLCCQCVSAEMRK